jgi:hypothetical protein
MPLFAVLKPVANTAAVPPHSRTRVSRLSTSDREASRGKIHQQIWHSRAKAATTTNMIVSDFAIPFRERSCASFIHAAIDGPSILRGQTMARSFSV